MTSEAAANRRLNKRICMKCYARNPINAEKCRKCGSKQLRRKKKEIRAV